MSQSKTTDRQIRASMGALPLTGTTIELSFTGTTAVSAALTVGVTYDITSDQDVYVCSNSTGVADATTNDYVIYKEQPGVFHTPTAQALYVSALRKSTNGTLKISPRYDTVQ